ncbi:MAG: glycosyl transferase family 1 [Opitutus sp.]|nr:glycosyl transferase family 1 [Opitutus sp.]
MTTDAVGGVWHYTLELCAGLGAHGVEVVLASMGPRPSEAQRAAARALGNVTLVESDFRLEWMPAPWDDVQRAGEWLLQLESDYAPDLVHLNGYVHAALPWRVPVLVVGHSCVFSWWEATHGTAPPTEWSEYRARVQAGLQAADRVVAPSHAMLAALERHYGALRRAEVIANGRNPAQFSRGLKKPSVLCVGRLWDEAKNARVLAEIAPRLHWPVELAGDTTAPHGITDRPDFPNVALLGPCSPARVRALLAQASIYALPARYEPFGLSVLEAALSGCALVLGDLPSLRENWDGAAVFVAPDDADGLVRELAWLIGRPEAANLWAQRARERAAEFSAVRMVTNYLAAYADCLTPRAAAQVESIPA